MPSIRLFQKFVDLFGNFIRIVQCDIHMGAFRLMQPSASRDMIRNPLLALFGGGIGLAAAYHNRRDMDSLDQVPPVMLQMITMQSADLLERSRFGFKGTDQLVNLRSVRRIFINLKILDYRVQGCFRYMQR